MEGSRVFLSSLRTLSWNHIIQPYASVTVIVAIKGSFTLHFFLIATAIPLITTNGLYRTQWKCSHYVTRATLLTVVQLIVSKNRSQSQIAQCRRSSSVYRLLFFHDKHYFDVGKSNTNLQSL